MNGAFQSLRRTARCLLVASLWHASAQADRFYLKSGGEIEAQLLATTDTHYDIRTFVGHIELPIENVERHEIGPSFFDEYDQRLSELSQTPDALFELAQWCEKAGLRRESKLHLEQALQRNPEHAATRAALGYVKVGHLWVEGVTVLESEADRQRAAQAELREQQRARAAERASLENDVRNIENRYFLGHARDKEDGFTALQRLAQRNPLALEAMFNVYDSSRRELTRLMMVDIFTRTPTTQTTEYLTIAATEDLSLDVRHDATEALLQRDVTEVVPLLTTALENESISIRDQAAAVLARLDDDSAIPALIDKLVGSREMYVAHRVLANRRIRNGDTMTNTERDAETDGLIQTDRRVRLRPGMGARNPANASDLIKPYTGGQHGYETEYRRESVPVYHSEVRNALVKITNQDFGFDQDAWKRWLKKSQRKSTQP